MPRAHNPQGHVLAPLFSETSPQLGGPVRTRKALGSDLGSGSPAGAEGSVLYMGGRWRLSLPGWGAPVPTAHPCLLLESVVSPPCAQRPWPGTAVCGPPRSSGTGLGSQRAEARGPQGPCSPSARPPGHPAFLRCQDVGCETSFPLSGVGSGKRGEGCGGPDGEGTPRISASQHVRG